MTEERTKARGISTHAAIMAAAFILTAAFVFVIGIDDTAEVYDATLSGSDLTDNVALSFYNDPPYGTSQWPWFFVGGLIGLVIAFVVWRIWHKGDD